MPAAFLRVPLTMTLVAECHAIADTVREVRSLADRLDMVRDVCRNVSAVPLAVLTEVLIPAHDCS